MDELSSEKEQLAELRTWWQENGRYIVSGIAIGVALLVGWNYWNDRRDQSGLEASAIYESLVANVADVEVEAAEANAVQLYENYASTAYAPQARLAMAKLYMDTGRDQDAADELRALLLESDNPEMQMTARLRLAKILLYQEKPDEAVDLVQGFPDSAFAARYNETLGDAYVQQEKFGDAKEAYTAALADNPEAPTVNRALIQMKINDLPEMTVADTSDADAETGVQEPVEDTAQPDDAAEADEPAE